MRAALGISTPPSSGVVTRAISFISVDLPAPLRPISPTRARVGIAAVARSRMTRPPRRTVTALIVSMAAPYHGRPAGGRRQGAAAALPVPAGRCLARKSRVAVSMAVRVSPRDSQWSSLASVTNSGGYPALASAAAMVLLWS